MIKLRITPDGRIRGLWSDYIPLGDLGSVHVRRASHVEFDNRLQRWTVRPASRSERISQRVLYQCQARADALAWENKHFRPGGPFWPQLANCLDNCPDHSPFHF